MDNPLESISGAPALLEASSKARLLSDGRFRLRLTALVVLIVLVLTGLMFLLVGQVFSNLQPALERDLKRKVESGLAELSHSADLALLTSNPALIEQAARRYLDDPDIVHLEFQDSNGALVFSHGRQKPPPFTDAMTVSESKKAYFGWSPITVEGLSVGRVSLAVSKERLEAGSRLHRRILLTGLIGAAVALGLAVLFVRLYIVPVLRLTQHAFDELKRTTEMALLSAKAKSQFLANMSHEIRTPMNGLLGMLHLLDRTQLAPAQRRYLEVMTSSARSLLTVVNDILDFSKLEARSYRLSPSAYNVSKLLDDSVGLFANRAKEKGLSLTLDVARDMPSRVWVDGDRVRQVVNNLVGNAVKFTDKGGIVVQAGASRRATDDDGTEIVTLRVEVTDTGIGIPAAAREKLFKAFSQVDESSTRLYQGTGLGLAICKKLVELMGGTIEHRDSVSGGSVFSFSLPVRRCPDASSSPDVEAVAGRFKDRLRVLVVDDNEINQVVAEEMLDAMGLDVDVVSNGLEAVEAAERGDYAAVLMDCQMPGMDGYQATREIRARERGRRVPIIACTAHALAEEREKVTACGMDDYIAKPVTPAGLRQVLARWIETPGVSDSASAEARPEAAVTNDSAVPGGLTQDSSPSEANPSGVFPGEPIEEPLDEVILEVRRGLSASLRSLFLRQVTAEIDMLKIAAARGDEQQVIVITHKLKGSAGAIGAMRLTEACDRLQRSASQLSDPRLLAAVNFIERIFAQTRTALENLEVQESLPPESL